MHLVDASDAFRVVKTFKPSFKQNAVRHFKPAKTLVHKEPGLRILRGLRSTRETFEITTPDARVRVRAILRGAGRAEGVRLSLERQAT